ncbi:MAG TPA: hypothetical protein VFQ73_00790 [Flavisolibacter sp.]|nr:hypothetical protein [Flavisolibacter sp.]
MSNEVASLTILVSHQSGTETVHQVVPFKIFQEDSRFKAIPLIGQKEREVSQLSEALFFELSNQRIVPAIGITHSNMDVLNKIVQELRIQKLIS